MIGACRTSQRLRSASTSCSALLLKLVPEAEELTAEQPRGGAHPGSKLYGVVDGDRMRDTARSHEVAQTIAATQPHEPVRPRSKQPGEGR